MAARIPVRGKMTWDVSVSIPFNEVAEFLTDTEYYKMVGIIHEDIRISIHFDYSSASPEVGIFTDSMDYNGRWDWIGKDYGDVLKSAIDNYLIKSDMCDTYSKKALFAYHNYCNFLKNDNQ